MPTISTLTVDVESRTSGFSKGLKIATAGLAALAAGAAYTFKQFEDAEKISKQTEAVITSTGGAANVTAKQVEGLAAAISKKTGIDDEAIQSGQNLLLTFKNIANETGKGNDIFNQATTAITDMSVAMGQDFKSSAIQVGKALNDPIAGLTALGRVGVQFTDEQKKTIEQFVKHNNILGAQKVILGELSSQFAGSAEAQKTASGTMATALGNLAETIGGVLAPAVGFVAEKLTGFVTFLTTNVGPAFQTVREAVAPLVEAIGERLAPVIEGIVEWFGKVADVVGPVAATFAGELVEALTQTWNVLKSNLGPMLEALWSLIKKVWDIIKPVVIVVGVLAGALLKLALEAIPIVIGAITKIIEWAARIIEAFLAVVTFVRDKFVEPVVNFLGRVIDAIGRVIGWVRDKLVAAWQAIVAPIKAAIDAVIGFVQSLIDKIGDAIEGLRTLLEKIGSGLGGNIGVPPTFPSGQHGGVVAKTGLAVIHKGEAISGVHNEMGFGAGINGDIVLNIDGQTFARITRDQLLKLQRRNATSGL